MFEPQKLKHFEHLAQPKEFSSKKNNFVMVSKELKR
jgi:hypothetical protein